MNKVFVSLILLISPFANAGVSINIDQHISNNSEIVSITKSSEHDSERPITIKTSNGLTYRLSEYSLSSVKVSFLDMVAMVNQTQPEISPYDLVISAGWDSVDYKTNTFYIKSVHSVGLAKKK